MSYKIYFKDCDKKNYIKRKVDISYGISKNKIMRIK